MKVGNFIYCGRHNVLVSNCKFCQQEQMYMRIAQEFADQSKDPKFKVGALIVTQEGIMYPGYNGDEIGGTNKRDSMDTGQSGFVHAEANAIIKFNPTIHKGCTMYLTYNPCIVCSRMIINTQAIKSVIYKNEYSADVRGIEILKKANILCEKLVIVV